MTHYDDLTVCDHFGPSGGNLIAIGWLDAGHAYNHGDVSPGTFQALVRLLVSPWQPAISAGRYDCGLCRFTGGPAELTYGGEKVGVGVTNLFIPSNGRVFVSPSMIAHYIDAHGYAPPIEYQVAVNRCPEMGSMQYLRAMREHGLHKIRLP